MDQEAFRPVSSPESACYTHNGASRPRISDAINAASSRPHDTLNRLILDRIPLALPPTASDPLAYGRGIAAFAQIYFAFEHAWQDLIDSLEHHDANDNDSRESQLRRRLATLRPRGLARSERFRQDLAYLSRRTGVDLESDRHIQQRIFRKVRRSVSKKPHTLVAFAWVMYMALFSGGRVIRHHLSRAGAQFWQERRCESMDDAGAVEGPHGPPNSIPGFSFLYFDDGKDGNELKGIFKSRLAELETLLSDRERGDVVQTAVGLFDECIALVGMLDRESGVTFRRRHPSRTWITAGLLVVLSVMGFVAYHGVPNLDDLGWPAFRTRWRWR